MRGLVSPHKNATPAADRRRDEAGAAIPPPVGGGRGSDHDNWPALFLLLHAEEPNTGFLQRRQLVGPRRGRQRVARQVQPQERRETLRSRGILGGGGDQR